MFPDVVEALLGRRVRSADAVLDGYHRHAIDRGRGGAKGPVIFKESGFSVEGRILEGIERSEQTLINAFETAAGGYRVVATEVLVAGDRHIPAATYEGTEALETIVVGDWSVSDFEREHLKHYIEERIPSFREQWEKEAQ